MRRLAALLLAVSFAAVPVQARAASAYGSSEYGDPPGWCRNHSDMWIATVETNDPNVGTNPERDTFYGFHRNPGYDDWYGYFYGDFRGVPGDSSGWTFLLHENYPRHYHWNFSDFGWAVHGHAKEYIAYYNWTFGGECGIGRYGSGSPPPYMADQYGYPVVDIYVDAVPPSPPVPRVTAIDAGSVTFTWDPVTDQGDGSGTDYYVSGLDHYDSWATIGGRPDLLDYASTPEPRTVQVGGLVRGQVACAHVEAVDRVGNATADQSVCASPLVAPPMPAWAAPAVAVAANPTAPGLAGLATWLWLAPRPPALTAPVVANGITYAVTATPAGARWDFGDGTAAVADGAAAGFGLAFPAQSTVSHVYETDSALGYVIHASVRYAVTWTATVDGVSFGPYPLGEVSLDATPLTYRVLQAQPVLVAV